MFDVTGLPWHFAGVRDVKGCPTAADVMRAANLDFKVNLCDMYANMPSTDAEIDMQLDADGGVVSKDNGDFLYGGRSLRKLEGNFITYRTDNNVPLGKVQSRYTVVQNTDAFKFFDSAIGEGRAIWDTAGCLDGGRRIFVSAKLPDDIVVNGKDHISNYLVFVNSHDGSSGVNIMFTPVRIICKNCLPGARRNAEQFIRFKHTQSVHGKIDQAAEILGIARQQEIVMQTEFNKMAQVKMNDLQVMDYIASIHLNAEEYKSIKSIPNGMRLLFAKNFNVIDEAQLSTRKVNMLTQTMDYYISGPGQREIAGTAWGAFNAITGYYSNVTNMRDDKRFDSLLFGNAGNVMNKALNSVAV